MAVPNSNTKIVLSGLARRLVLDGILEEKLAIQAIEDSSRRRVPLVNHLVDEKIVSAADVGMVASQEFGVPLFDISTMDMEMAPVDMVEEKLLRKHHALPLLKRGNRLYLAVSDPTNLNAMDEIKFHVGCNTEAILVEHDKLSRAIDNAMDAADTTMADLADADLDGLEISGVDDMPADGNEPDIDDTPIVRFVNKILLDAINMGASDIHFEPYEKTYRIRVRHDGILREVANPPNNLSPRLSARLKVMARLDISEKRVPQDGRMKMTLSKNRSIDFRVNTCPTLFGEKIVLRILDSASAKLGIDLLGYEADQKDMFMNAIHRPQGMVLVTGPTGSGKTVSLYTALNILNTPDRNISTAEDPAEINLPGINQVNVNAKAGLTFASALRAFLRQDPDIIMVGEIRDLETAEIAVKAAQTGHMVLSTLHTNDAPQTLSRLANMGVAPYNIASSVTLIIAQRLARRLCSNCKEPADIPPEALIKAGFAEDEVSSVQVLEPRGCDQCNNNGYKGRVGIYQVMSLSEEIGRIIMEGGNSLQIEDQAKAEGVRDMRESGLWKVKEGVTSLEEVYRVTKD